MKIAVLFPGQGSQSAGMGKELYEQSETFAKAFDACCAATEIDIKKACFEGEGLELTSVTQPALYSVNIATYRMLQSMGIQADIFAGLSLGEYDALAAAGVLDYAKTAGLVTVRGRLMESAVPPGIASMTAVIGLPSGEIEDAIADIEDVWVANMNSPEQTIIGGKLEALNIADVKVKEAGAKIVKRLDVAGPFHTPLLEEAGEKLHKELSLHEIYKAQKDIYANVTGALYGDNSDVRTILAKQVSNKVMWSEITDKVIKTADVVIECGPGNVLSKLTKKRLKALGKDVAVFKISSMKDAEEIKQFIGG